MEDRELIFFGTLGLFTYNLLVAIFIYIGIINLQLVWAIIMGLPFAVGAIYFDVLVVRYFINKIKSRKR